jgi:hypothetical protein
MHKHRTGLRADQCLVLCTLCRLIRPAPPSPAPTPSPMLSPRPTPAAAPIAARSRLRSTSISCTAIRCSTALWSLLPRWCCCLCAISSSRIARQVEWDGDLTTQKTRPDHLHPAAATVSALFRCVGASHLMLLYALSRANTKTRRNQQGRHSVVRTKRNTMLRNRTSTGISLRTAHGPSATWHTVWPTCLATPTCIVAARAYSPRNSPHMLLHAVQPSGTHATIWHTRNHLAHAQSSGTRATTRHTRDHLAVPLRRRRISHLSLSLLYATEICCSACLH